MLRPASVVHGNHAKEDYLYVCSRYPDCDSYVGAHRKSLKPLGVPAGPQLRQKRILAHQFFDQLWQSKIMEKWQAYKWMEEKFGLNSQQAHIAKFSEDMCDELIAECKQVLKNNNMWLIS